MVIYKSMQYKKIAYTKRAILLWSRRSSHVSGLLKLEVIVGFTQAVVSASSPSFMVSIPEAFMALLYKGNLMNILIDGKRSMMMLFKRGVVYRLRFRPPGVKDRIISIQWLSFCLLWSASSPWIFSTTMMDRSWREWSGWAKWLATGLSIHWWLMSDWCPVKCTWSAFSISPVYWMEHFYIL